MKYLLIVLAVLLTPAFVFAQENEDQAEENITITANAGDDRITLTGKELSFDIENSNIPEGVTIQEILWNFGDGIRTTGEKVSHKYISPGTYTVTLNIRTDQDTSEGQIQVTVFDEVIILLSDASVADESLALHTQNAADEGILLLSFKAKTGGPEAIVEEELTQALSGAREDVARANTIISWTRGGIGANVLSRFGQSIKQSEDTTLTDLNMDTKGIIVISESPFGVISPIAQSTYDQLEPLYVMLTRPDAIPLTITQTNTDITRQDIVSSPIEYRLLGTFSSRAVSEVGLTNFMSVGINLLINGGVPINNIVLVLMIPIIATILSFARQIIGIKAFGLITPAMTTLSFLVMGLTSGLIVFLVVLASGSLTRLLLRKLHLLYLPRMALVLTSASIAILALLGFGVATGTVAQLSFSIFPILILTILAEEFIAVQFSRGISTAMRVTAWTIILSVICYYAVSWQLLRVFLLSYPEIILLAIPINILLGRFTGLRLVEYLRFKELLRYDSSHSTRS